MKSKIFACLLLAAVFLFTACAANNTKQPDANSQASRPEGPAVKAGLVIDEDADEVHITLPESIVDPKIIGNLSDDDKANGFKSVTINSNGTATYTISQADYAAFMQQLAGKAKAYADIMPDEFKSVTNATVNDNMQEGTITVKRAAYEKGMDATVAPLVLYAQVAFYQVFDGVPEEDIKMQIHLIDESTGEIFHTIFYPEDLDKQ